MNRFLLIVGILAWCAAPGTGVAQTRYNPKPAAADSMVTQSNVRGLFDGPPAGGPAGMDGAPAATFIAPGAITDENGVKSTVTSSSTLPSDARPIEGSEIVARVEDHVVLASDVLWQVNQMIKMSGQQVPAAQLPQVQQMLMQKLVMQLIDTKLLFADFRRTVPAENLGKVHESIAEPFEEIEVPKLIKMFGVKDRTELEAALKPSGASLKEVQRQFTEKTVAQEWIRQKMPKPKPISHEELLAYYQDHVKEYEYPSQVRWEELMVRFDRVEGGRDGAWKALAEMGNEVWSQVVANPGIRGPVFAGIAKERSHGFTADKGGVHDWTTYGSLKCEEINEALATLEVGQLSPGIESEYGFHIVRVLERKLAGRTPFTEAQAKIRETLEAEQKESLLNDELVKLRKNARVWTIWHGEINGPRLAELLGDRQKR